METENSKTTFVTVNHIFSSIDSSLYIDSKTTFVTVNLYSGRHNAKTWQIQKQPLLLLI